jgi:hypothetical protein
MGLFDRWRTRAEVPWEPPALGACSCEEHVENLRDHHAGEREVTVGELLDSGALAAEPAGPEPAYVALPVTGQRLGPFHWALMLTGRGTALYDAGAPAALDDCLSLQPGIDRVLWPEPERFLVGAPTLCASGVMAALVSALDNPRVRRET